MLALVLAVGSAACSATHHFPDQQVHLAVTVYAGDPLGSVAEGTVRVVGHPQFITFAGRPAYWHNVQEVRYTTRTGQKVVEQVGTNLELLPVLYPDGIWVELNITHRDRDAGLGIRTADGWIDGFTQQQSRVGWMGKAGEPFRRRIAARSATDQTWVEVTARSVK